MTALAESAPSPARYRKKAIPNRIRRELALRYGCPPGGEIQVPCHYCGTLDFIFWHQKYGGEPSTWVSFGHEIDHVHPEVLGGEATLENLVLACRSCNRRKAASVRVP